MTEEQARRQIRKEREFYSHLGTYVVVCSALAAMSMLTSPGYFWAIWPILGWGIGLASHALKVFGVPGRRKDWEEQRMRQLTGAEGSAQRLRTLVDEAVETRTRPRRGASGRAETAEEARLRERVEHLEAIVTSHDWDTVAKAPPAAVPAATVPSAPVPPRSAVELPDDAEEETPEARAARLARRIR